MIFLVHKLLFLNHSSANQCVFALALSTVCPFVWLSVQLSDLLCVCLLSWLPVPLCTSSFVFVCMPTITLAALICLPACLPLCSACNCMCTRQISINFMLIICRFMILAYGPKKKKKGFSSERLTLSKHYPFYLNPETVLLCASFTADKNHRMR